MSFLTNYNDNTFNIQIRASDYYNFVMLVLVAVGVVFELPVFVLALVRLGILPRTGCVTRDAWATSSWPSSACCCPGSTR